MSRSPYGTGRPSSVRDRCRRIVSDRLAQMTVELAVLAPVVIVVALTVANLARFVELCAEFDRVAPDMVVAHGVAPEGESSQAAAVVAVESAIASAMGVDGGLGRVGVRVGASTARPAEASDGCITFPVSPLLTEFSCELTYHPWPGSFVIAGVSYESPLALRHVRRVVVDRYRPGVVV